MCNKQKDDSAVSHLNSFVTERGNHIDNAQEKEKREKEVKKFSVGWAIFWAIITGGPGLIIYIAWVYFSDKK